MSKEILKEQFIRKYARPDVLIIQADDTIVEHHQQLEIDLNEVIKFYTVKTADQPKTDCLDSQEFNDLMSCYRMTDMIDQDLVIRRFEAVKEWIRKNYSVS